MANLQRRSSYAEGVEFNSRTGQILHSVTNSLPPLQRLLSSRLAVLPLRYAAEMG